MKKKLKKSPKRKKKTVITQKGIPMPPRMNASALYTMIGEQQVQIAILGQEVRMMRDALEQTKKVKKGK